jgi:uncharacterized membrane protein YccC
VVPGLFTLLGVISGIPGLALVWLFFTAALVFLAWRARRTPWWAVMGWMLCAFGGVNVGFSVGAGESAVVGALIVVLGAGLGIAGLVINAMKREAPRPAPIDPA